jgi:hypothetical protein
LWRCRLVEDGRGEGRGIRVKSWGWICEGVCSCRTKLLNLMLFPLFPDDYLALDINHA